MESILTSIKKLLGIPEDYEQFDAEIIIHINSVFSILTQIGVGPDSGYKIVGKEETWDDFLSGRIDIEDVKTYVYLKVRLAFDPPINASVVDAIKNQISEYEWRINVAVDAGDDESSE